MISICWIWISLAFIDHNITINVIKNGEISARRKELVLWNRSRTSSNAATPGTSLPSAEGLHTCCPLHWEKSTAANTAKYIEKLRLHVSRGGGDQHGLSCRASLSTIENIYNETTKCSIVGDSLWHILLARIRYQQNGNHFIDDLISEIILSSSDSCRILNLRIWVFARYSEMRTITLSPFWFVKTSLSVFK